MNWIENWKIVILQKIIKWKHIVCDGLCTVVSRVFSLRSKGLFFVVSDPCFETDLEAGFFNHHWLDSEHSSLFFTFNQQVGSPNALNFLKVRIILINHRTGRIFVLVGVTLHWEAQILVVEVFWVVVVVSVRNYFRCGLWEWEHRWWHGVFNNYKNGNFLV